MGNISTSAERAQAFSQLLDSSCEYFKAGLWGEPCEAFPELTAFSSDADIEQAITARYQVIKQTRHESEPTQESPACSPKAECLIMAVCRLYASEYVRGAQCRFNNNHVAS